MTPHGGYGSASQRHEDVIAEARLLKLGKRLAVGEVSLYSAAGGDPVAHVTSTYSIPPKRD